MRVRLKGINSKTVTLADGTKRTYYWAWKGGPRVKGEFGTPEFMASFYAAVSAKRAPPSDTLLSILQGYQASAEFLNLAERTRDGYVKQIKKIEAEFIDFPLSALTDKRTRGDFLAWRDRLATRSRRQADYAWTVLARVLSWALGRGLIDANPCLKGGRLYRGSRKDKVWTLADEEAFLNVAPDRLSLALTLALWTGQRQGDLLRLPWSAYDGTHIRLRQSKTGTRVLIPVGAPLKAVLDSTPRRNELILVNIDGVPWNENGFRSSWKKACIKAGIKDLTFNDLRGTAVTRLALAGCTEAEIATISGHTLRDVRSILDAHYLSRDPALGESAIRKLEISRKVRRLEETLKKRTKLPE